jgi:hypothetical protein
MAKEPKDPAFPHPALETGVPHYPTPNVPDFYTRDGHILLVEKISTDKGSYNPKPLDGSVTYSGKDARKWPSELYLVAERPTADGMFAYRFWANDRTMASQDPWNYGVSYSENDPAFPVYARQYIVPRSQYAPIAKGEKDPIFGGDAIVAQQQMQELDDENPLRSRYVQMVVQYESIPGPVVVGSQINQRGDVETVEVQTVVAGTAPDADSLLTTSSSVDPVDSIKSKRKKSSVTTYTTLTSKEKKSGILGITTSTDDVVDPSTNPDALSATVLQSSVQQISKTKARKVTTSIDNTITLGGAQKREGLLGEVRTSESIVPANTLPDALTTTVVSSQVEPIDSVKSKKTTITAIGPSSLVGGESKGGLLGDTTIKESIVSAGTAPDALSASVLESKVTPMDSGKSKKTTISSTGPIILEGGKTNSRGDKETTTKSIVSYNSPPSAESYLLQGSQVEPIDSFKSQKVDVVVDKYSTLSGNSFQMGGGVGAAGGAETKITNQIVDAASYVTPTPSLTTLAYQEKPISTSKIEVVTETLVDTAFPQIRSSEIDPVTHTNVFSTYTQIVDPGNSASASGGVINEYSDLDKWHSQLTHKDYSSLIGETWTEYENESYAPPAKIRVQNGILSSLLAIIEYVRPQPKTVTARVDYKIEASAVTVDCFNPLTQTLITDFGTFTNVIHNVVQYVANGQTVIAIPSSPNSQLLPSEIVYRFSCTRIPRMGGLYLSKKVTIPFASLYS